jgi:streptogramin lyase
VARLTSGGQLSTFASGFSVATGLAFDSQGNLYVASYSAGTVSEVTPAGQVSLFANGFSNPNSLAFDAVGNLYVANASAGSVSLVTPAKESSRRLFYPENTCLRRRIDYDRGLWR